MKLSLILLAGLAGAACLRTRSAALRHWIIAIAIVGAGAAPFVETVVPHWVLNVPATAAASGDSSVNVEVSVRAPSEPAVRAQQRARPAGAAGWLRLVWMAGAALSLFVLASGLARLAWLAAHARPASARWTALARQICEERRLRRTVRLLQSDHPSLLATWGTLRPRIILPAPADGWPDDLVRIVLHHEIAHIRRFDWLAQIAGELLRSVYWFNPLAWLACGRLRTESEQACDDEVLSTSTEPETYATHLLTLARALNPHRMWSPAPAMARRSTLHRRVAAMLNTRTNRNPLAPGTRLGTLALLLAVTIALAAAQTSATLSGTFHDSQGGVLPGVQVILTDSDGKTQETRTGAAGQFQFAGLAPGDYALEAQLPGFKTYKRTVSVSSANVVQTIVLDIGQVQEAINVVDDGAPAPAPASAAAPRSKPACQEQAAANRVPIDGQIRVGGNVRPPIKFKDVHPEYPAALRGTGTSAQVVLDAVIGVDGFVHDIHPRDVHLVSPKLPAETAAKAEQSFADAFIAAVAQWQFDATLLNCVAIETPITITGTFRPQQAP